MARVTPRKIVPLARQAPSADLPCARGVLGHAFDQLTHDEPGENVSRGTRRCCRPRGPSPAGCLLAAHLRSNAAAAAAPDLILTKQGANAIASLGPGSPCRSAGQVISAPFCRHRRRRDVPQLAER